MQNAKSKMQNQACESVHTSNANEGAKAKLTVSDIIEKRRLRWQEKQDIEYDRKLVRASVDKILDTPELREEIQAKPHLLIEVAFTIVDKNRKTVPFFLNEVQRDFIAVLEREGTARPFFVLKGRQQGFTSLITAIQLSHSIVKRNFSGMTIADKSSNSITIFNDKAKAVYDRLPDRLKPHEKFNSRNEIFFDKLNSAWRIDTATDLVGRSRTLSFLHLSEVAFYGCSLAALQAAIGASLVKDSIIVYESTANGFNEAKELWDQGSCINLFYEWWRSSEYRSTRYEYLEFQDGWLEERKKLLFELGLDREQVTWYCETYKGYIDKSLIRQEFPCTPEEAFVSTGKSVFDTELLTVQLARVARLPAGRRGYFTYRKVCTPIYTETGELADTEWSIEDIEFVERQDGYIVLHEEPEAKRDREGNPTELAPYVLGGDTAGTGEDYFTAKVICNLDGRTAATLRIQRIDEDAYAEQLICLGYHYNTAFIGVEVNYSYYPTRVIARKYHYPSLYVRERLDRVYGETVKDYGFETTKKTKPTIIGELVEIMRAHPELECDRETLREMTTFVKKPDGSQEAIEGQHDDLVMALAIAHHISGQYTHSYVKVEEKRDDSYERFFGRTDGGEDNGGYIDWDDF